MAQPTWSLQDARNRFSALVEAARKTPQIVTKHGKPAAVVVSAAEYERLRTLQRLTAPSFAQMLLAMPQGDAKFQRLKTKPRDVTF